MGGEGRDEGERYAVIYVCGIFRYMYLGVFLDIPFLAFLV